MEVQYGEWTLKGATLSDKTAREEYGLTQREIYAAIDAASSSTDPVRCTVTRGCDCYAAR